MNSLSEIEMSDSIRQADLKLDLKPFLSFLQMNRWSGDPVIQVRLLHFELSLPFSSSVNSISSKFIIFIDLTALYLRMSRYVWRSVCVCVCVC